MGLLVSLGLFVSSMSHSSKIFEEVPIKVQNKNGFDLSHLNCGTSKCGQLVPVMCKLLPPNSDFTLGISMNVELPPLATQFLGRIDAICEGFIIPLSMLYGGWKVFISGQESTMFPATQSGVEATKSRGVGLDGETVMTKGGYAIPYFDLTDVYLNDIANFATLMASNDNIYEYLGVRPSSAPVGSTGNPYYLNMLSGLAYHLIWDVYYRNKQVTKTVFAVNPNVGVNSGFTSGSISPSDSAALYFNDKNVSLIWHSFYTAHPGIGYSNAAGSVNLNTSALFNKSFMLTFPDGVSFFSTRQRNYARDYFSASMPSPQQGSPSALVFDTSGSTGQFTINALRAANSLQKFLETNSLSGDFADMIRNRWGVRPIDADFDEPYYLGRVVLPVYQKSVYNQNAQSSELEVASQNPFTKEGVLGAKGASGSFVGEGSISDKFHNTTWSYLMCLFSLVPHAAYGYGLNRELMFRELGDFPAPELQAIGNEAIKACELYYEPAFADTDFAYTGRFSRFKYMDDEIHGELRPGRSLESFVLQRRLSYSASADRILDTDFLEIPQNALDSVFAVSTDEMKLSCWYEIYFKFKVAMPLADYAIPTLGDIQDTHTIHTQQGGSRL